MGKKIIIVESPAKARTINNILKNEYQVMSSVGHIRDLPKTRFGVDIDNNYQPEYVTISGKQKIVEQLKRAAKNADMIFLAADPDREGEAICWHLMHYLKEINCHVHRILYFEITPSAIKKSLSSPESLNLAKINAQQARRVLDRIVGYRLSPLLWKKVKRGLSAGRVQSVALKIICDREREIQSFVPIEYWTLTAKLASSSPPDFYAYYYGSQGKKRKLSDEDQTLTVLSEIKDTPFIVQAISSRKVYRNPPPPFITSTLQQEAAKRFRFPAKKTMRIAQALYEGKAMTGSDVHGLITYMRTDSPRVSSEAQESAKLLVSERFGKEYLPAKPPVYKAKKSAQEAHEAIRPTDIDLSPEKAAEFLKGEDLKLYTLIWERFIASQMASAHLSVTTVKIYCGAKQQHEFRASGTEVIFKGFWQLTGNPLKIKNNLSDTEESDGSDNSQILPKLNSSETLKCLGLDSEQKFTKPPSRFSEASLVKELETQGIGRPSTYAAIMTTIRDHNYVHIIDRKFVPTDLGFCITDLLTEYFPNIMSVKFTADLETRLDGIEKENSEWTSIVDQFYRSFSENLRKAEKSVEKIKPKSTIVEGYVCPDCGGEMVIRWGKKGRFLSCASFPDCKGILPFPEAGKNVEKTKHKGFLTSAKCPDCGALLVLKSGRFGRFLACQNFPKCKGKGPKPEGKPCPVDSCDGVLVQKRGKSRRSFYGCSNYPTCRFTFQGVLIPVACKACGFDYMSSSARKLDSTVICPRCNFNEELSSIDENRKSDTEISDIS
ncbi:type I DNA topoisomerase [bacterium]|nr:type I DNA topoisomerase [candidate division CSSED10-310 bacterium]